MEFTEQEKNEIIKLRTQYPDSRSLTLPLMWMIQNRAGYVSDEACRLIAQELSIPTIWVEEVRSWYSMFSDKKEGTYVLEVCHNISCSLLGSEDIIDYLSQKLGIKVGETTSDGLFTLKTAECLGSCGAGPVMQVGTVYYDILDKSKIDKIIFDLKNGVEQKQEVFEFPVYK